MLIFVMKILPNVRHRWLSLSSKMTRTISYVTAEKFIGVNNLPVLPYQRRQISNINYVAKLSSDNIISSPFEDMDVVTKELVHEQIWKNLHKWANKTALICAETGRSYTYEQLRKLSGRFATSLRKKFSPGDTIAIAATNVPEYAIVTLGASEAGLKVSLINVNYTPYEINRQLLNSEALAVFTVPSKYADVMGALENNSNIKMPPIVISDGDPLPSGCLKLDDMIADGIDDFEKIEKTGVDYQDTIFLPYSSGTTGLPKGVELSHKNIVACIGQMSHEAINPTIEATESYQDIIPVILPMFHIYALTLCLCKGLCFGAKLVCVPRFSPERFLQVLHKSHPTLIYVAPPIMQFLAYNDKVTRSHLESLRIIISGAASLSNECIKRFQNRAPSDLATAQGYGLSETSPTLTLRKDSYQDINSTGFIIPNTQFRIVGYQEEKLGCNLGFDEIGEIYVKGPQVMKGYYKNPKATAESMDGDWFKTGDLGFVKNDGALFVTGRLKELIKVKGLQVSPLELEEVIQTHENITDVAVIGVENDRFGEIPMAFVVSKPGSKISEDDIKDFVAQRLAKHKHLGHVKFVQQIPKSSAGKILRKELRRIAT